MSHQGAEHGGTDQIGQLIPPGLGQGGVGGIHPFDGQLRRTAYIDHAGRCVNGVYFFRRGTGTGEGGKLPPAVQKIEVGHIIPPFFRSVTTIII